MFGNLLFCMHFLSGRPLVNKSQWFGRELIELFKSKIEDKSISFVLLNASCHVTSYP